MNYEFAALDFIIDKKNNILFLEANSVPGALTGLKLYEKQVTIPKFKQMLKGKKVVLISRNKKFIKGWQNKLAPIKLIPRASPKYVKKLKPDVVIRLTGKTQELEKCGIKVINPISIKDICLEKYDCSELIKKAGIKIPRQIFMKRKEEHKQDAIDFFKKIKKGIVLKPNTGEKATGIIVIRKLTDFKKVPKKFPRNYIAQELIDLKKFENAKYWNIRSFLIHGKHTQLIIRYANHFAPAVCHGAKVSKLPKKLLPKIKKMSEKIVKVIEKQSKSL